MWDCEVQFISGKLLHCVFPDESEAREFYASLKKEDGNRYVDYNADGNGITIDRNQVSYFSRPRQIDQMLRAID